VESGDQSPKENVHFSDFYLLLLETINLKFNALMVPLKFHVDTCLYMTCLFPWPQIGAYNFAEKGRKRS
jgi:hypothetical protein